VLREEKTVKRRILLCLALFITAARLEAVQAQALRLDSIEPQRAERGSRLVIRGSLGPAEVGKAIRLARVVDRNAIFYYPAILRWTRDEAEVSLPRNLPVDRYLVTVVYPERPTRHSNNLILTIREPAPPAEAGNDPNPVVVLANRCMSRPRRRTSRSQGEYEISTGGMYAACETMRSITGQSTLSAFPGDEITIDGYFGNRRADQHVALAKSVEVYSERERRNIQRLEVSHLLQIVAWSSNRVTVRIGDHVRSDDYRLLILNRLSRSVLPGIFEEGSTIIQLRVRRPN
jgi:hypothetical protein